MHHTPMACVIAHANPIDALLRQLGQALHAQLVPSIDAGTATYRLRAVPITDHGRTTLQIVAILSIVTRTFIEQQHALERDDHAYRNLRQSRAMYPGTIPIRATVIFAGRIHAVELPQPAGPLARYLGERLDEMRMHWDRALALLGARSEQLIESTEHACSEQLSVKEGRGALVREVRAA